MTSWWKKESQSPSGVEFGEGDRAVAKSSVSTGGLRENLGLLLKGTGDVVTKGMGKAETLNECLLHLGLYC